MSLNKHFVKYVQMSDDEVKSKTSLYLLCCGLVH